MHKYLLHFCFVLFLFTTSCKKEASDTLKSQLTGKWTYTALTEKNYTSAGVLLTDQVYNYTLKAGDYIEFKSDGTWTQVSGGSQASGTYTITSSNQFELINSGIDNPCHISSISSSNLTFVLDGPKRGTDNYKEVTHSLKK